MTLDILFKAATVVDGTGAPRFTADVGIVGGRIAEVGRITAHAKRGVEAAQPIVGPEREEEDVDGLAQDPIEPARAAGIRTVNLRIGVVVSARGGALAELLPPVRAGVGGVVGSGEQMFPWIATDDLVHMIHWLLGTKLDGAVNATAPNPVNNREFMKAVGKAVHRWTIFPLPATVVRLLFGEMGQEVLLEGQNAVPERALATGFRFTFVTLDSALRWELGP